MANQKKEEAKDWKVGDVALAKEQLMPLQNLYLKVDSIRSKTQALEQRREAIVMEANLIADRLKAMQQQVQESIGEFRRTYTTVKAELGIPDTLEINPEDGTIIKQEQPAQPQPQR